MDRWRSACKVFWRAEPAAALGLYLLLAAVTAGYAHRYGGHLAGGLGSLHTLIRNDASSVGLVTYAFCTWRMWLGGAYSWTLSVAWQVILAAVAVNACYRAPGLFVFGLLALALASLAPLFAPAVLDRVSDRAGQYAMIRAICRAFLAAHEQGRGPSADQSAGRA